MKPYKPGTVRKDGSEIENKGMERRLTRYWRKDLKRQHRGEHAGAWRLAIQHFDGWYVRRASQRVVNRAIHSADCTMLGRFDGWAALTPRGRIVRRSDPDGLYQIACEVMS